MEITKFYRYASQNDILLKNIIKATFIAVIIAFRKYILQLFRKQFRLNEKKIIFSSVKTIATDNNLFINIKRIPCRIVSPPNFRKTKELYNLFLQ